MSQSKLLSHAEAMTQNLLGLLIAFLVLQFFGVPFFTSLKIQGTLFVLSYIRSYGVRRFFNFLGIYLQSRLQRNNNETTE
jgi:hypothetical protein